MKKELRAIGIVQKKEINSKTTFEVLTVIHRNDHNQIKHINYIQIDIVNAHLFKYQAQIHKISKLNMHYTITFLIDEQYHHLLKSGMESMVTFNYEDQYKTELIKDILLKK